MEGAEEDDERDADGLSHKYDTIIVGTGMVESILACAIQTLPDKKVLHLDPLDFYGRDLSTVTLNQMMDITSFGGVSYFSPPEERDRDDTVRADMNSGNNDDTQTSLATTTTTNKSNLYDFLNGKGRFNDGNDIDSAVAEESDLLYIDTSNSRSRSCEWLLRVVSAPKIPILPKSLSQSSSSVVKIMYNKQKSHPSCFGYLMQRNEKQDEDKTTQNRGVDFSSENIHPSFFGYVTHNRITLQRAVYDGRNFSLDFSCKMLLSGGRMVESLINSDVGRYLEFKAIENIYIFRPDTLWEVPCSKSDVFSTKLLSAIEKRVLMKFLQFVRDWGQLDSGEELSTLNERELSIGAALSRPQNKVFNNANYDVSGFENAPFRDFMNHYKIPQKLQDIIIYALCLDTRPSQIEGIGNLGTIEALRALSLHLNSLGRYGSTAFLYPLYGVAEIAQAFCRMCAVWGGIYILRRGISQLIVNQKTNKVCAVEDDTGRFFACRNFICSASDWYIDSSSRKQIVCTRTSICEGDSSVLPNSPRAFGVIPSATQGLDNEAAVHLLQLNSSCNVCPDGACVLYITTTISITSCSNSEDEKDIAERHMSKIVDYLQKQNKFTEIFYVTTTKHLNDPEKIGVEDLPENVAICTEERQSIHFQECVLKAEEIFHKLYPDEEFLPTGATPSQYRGDVEEAEEVEYMVDELNRLQTSVSDESETTITASIKGTSECSDQLPQKGSLIEKMPPLDVDSKLIHASAEAEVADANQDETKGRSHLTPAAATYE